jgi:hypothetical protein
MMPPLPPGKHATGSLHDKRTDWFQQIAASLGMNTQTSFSHAGLPIHGRPLANGIHFKARWPLRAESGRNPGHFAKCCLNIFDPPHKMLLYRP